ncbi:MAG: hypothetical protein AAF960_20105, partial [Bacteroidota bacterium]
YLHLTGLEDGVYEVQLIDSMGRRLFSSKVNASVIEVKNIPAGKYQVLLQNTETQKMIRASAIKVE